MDRLERCVRADEVQERGIQGNEVRSLDLRKSMGNGRVAGLEVVER